MASARYNASSSSSEKKRIRDRRAQQHMRERKETLINSLQEKVAFCEQNHTGATIEQLLQTVESLRAENQILRDHIRLLEESKNSTSSTTPAEIAQTSDDQDSSGEGLPATAGSLSESHETSPALPHVGYSDWETSLQQALSQLDNSPFVLSPLIPGGSLCFPTISFCDPAHKVPNSAPTWCLVPMAYYDDKAALLPGICTWLSYPELIADCSPVPSPLDLLHGTKRNFLADQINRRMRLRRVREPECLGYGLLCYLFSKWLISPNATTFARLPPFMHPIVAQYQQGYPNAFDLLVWPQLRRNLIKKWHLYDYFELFGYLSCCARIRWPFGEPILERDTDDNLQIRQEFLDTVTRESGWGLTTEFIDKYPELLEGMDVEAVTFRMDCL